MFTGKLKEAIDANPFRSAKPVDPVKVDKRRRAAEMYQFDTAKKALAQFAAGRRGRK